MRIIDPIKQQAIRAALRIHAHLAGTSHLNGLVQLPTEEWKLSARLLSRLELAVCRGWRAASQSVLRDLSYSLRRLSAECEQCQANLPRPAAADQLAPPGEIVADILALETEFDGLEIKLDEQLLQVHTYPIELEDTALGRFRIELRWDLIGKERAYEVVAESPNTPEQDEQVTHPHVKDNLLCEGEGKGPIRQALAEGRLLDFFTIVRQILETYNPSSAFVELSRWNGLACKDCGYFMPSDDHSTCDRCNDPLCSECSVGCSQCHRYVCNGCSTTCESCDRTLCESCLQTADSAGRLLCSPCYEATLEESDENVHSQEDAATSAAVCPTSAAPASDALCLGQAALPA
jgi:hypothetical protein